MMTVLLVIHVLIALTMIATVLLQRSEGGALSGLGGGGGGGGGMMSGRGSANMLTRMTGVLAGLFMLTSLVLTMMPSGSSEVQSILDTPMPAEIEVPAEPAAPAAPVAD